jgi:hypothetical protein
MSTTGRLFRLGIGAGSIWLSLHMAAVVDAGIPPSWPNVWRVAWGVGMLAAMLLGAGFVAQALSPLFLGYQLRWFPTAPELRGHRGLGPVLTVAGVLLAALGVIRISWPGLLARAAVAALGTFLLVLVLLRTRGLWDAPSVQVWREVFGDRMVMAIYVILAVALIVFAVVG